MLTLCSKNFTKKKFRRRQLKCRKSSGMHFGKVSHGLEPSWKVLTRDARALPLMPPATFVLPLSIMTTGGPLFFGASASASGSAGGAATAAALMVSLSAGPLSLGVLSLAQRFCAVTGCRCRAASNRCSSGGARARACLNLVCYRTLARFAGRRGLWAFTSALAVFLQLY